MKKSKGSSRLPIATNRQTFKEFVTLLRPMRKRTFLAIALLVTASSAGLVATRLLGLVIDAATARDIERLNSLGMIAVLTTIAAVIFTFAGRAQIVYVAENALAALRSNTFRTALDIPIGGIERAGTADLLSRLGDDVSTATQAAHRVVPDSLTGCLAVVLTTIALVITSPLLAVASFIGLPILWFCIRTYVKRAGIGYRDVRQAKADLGSTAHEIGEGSSTIQAFRSQQAWRDEMRMRAEDFWTTDLVTVRARNILFPGSNVARLVSLAAVLVTGTWAHDRWGLSLGTLSAASLYTLQLHTPIGDLIESLDKLQQALTSMSRLVGVKLVASTVSTSGASDSSVPSNGSVQLRNVHFSYDDGREVLHGVDLQISDGERVAVVGPSGAGKTTMAKLVAGIHLPTSGKVVIGGSSVDANTTQEQGRVALVTQESHLFMGTLAENLRLARPSATDDELSEVLSSVDAKHWVEQLPNGINEVIGFGGHSLTIVQAQQLALARVLLTDPLVVILDEATSLLDSSSARGVEQAFQAVFSGRTVITIAHRLDVALTADKVIVVESGNAHIGQHQELLDSVPAYAQLWSQWSVNRH